MARIIYCDVCSRQINENPKFLNISSEDNKPLIQEREICAHCYEAIKIVLNDDKLIENITNNKVLSTHEETKESTNI